MASMEGDPTVGLKPKPPTPDNFTFPLKRMSYIYYPLCFKKD